MNLFKKQTSTPEPTGRRRPLASDQASQRTKAFSYYSQRSNAPANTGRGQQLPESVSTSADTRRRAWYQNRAVTALACFLGLAGAVYLCVLSPNPKVVSQTANGGTYFLQEPAVYEQAAAHSLGSSILNRSKLTADTAKVSKDLTQNYPEIHTATVAVPLLGQRPVVYIEPYRPSFVLTTTDNKAYLLDETGRALASVSQITDNGELSVPTVEDKSGIQVNLGARALPTNTVQFTSQIASILDAAKVRYQSLVLPPASSELDVYISGTPYFVKFNLQADARLQAGTYLATKQRLEKDKITPSQYIDVRVNERAYYK